MMREDAEKLSELLGEVLDDCRALEKLVPNDEDQQRLGLGALGMAAERALAAVAAEGADPEHRVERCSFCGKPGSEVGRLIEGRASLICAECVDLCTVILAEHEGPERPSLAQIRGEEEGDGPISSVRPSETPPRL
jgi:hypothetical protein